MSMPSSLRDGAYRRWLSADLSALIDSKELSLSVINKTYLRSRWLVQILQLEQNAGRTRLRYQALRLITAIGSLLLVMLVTLRFNDALLGAWASRIYYTTVVLSLMVAASVAVEQMYNFGERGRSLQRLLDKLKTEGWCFLQLSGRYNNFNSHEEAFAAFANQVESLSRQQRQQDAEVFIPEIVPDRRVIIEPQRAIESETVLTAPEKKSVYSSPKAAATTTTTTSSSTASTVPHRINTVSPSSVSQKDLNGSLATTTTATTPPPPHHIEPRLQ